MINLEWLRSFRSVYTNQSVSKAAEQLNISQPTVSQHIASLESYLGKSLFERKSKGVIPTGDGRQLSNLVAGSIEALEVAELSLTRKDSVLHSIRSIGISKHLFSSILAPAFHKIGSHVHVYFHKRDELIREVERGNLLYAIIPDSFDSFDLNCDTILDQHLILTASPEINLPEFKKLYRSNKEAAEKWLYQYPWYAHDSSINFVKTYWLKIFDKKRPTLVAQYVIPNEHEVLHQLSKGSGLSVAFNTTAKPFIDQKKLIACDISPKHKRKLSLISNKKKTDPVFTEFLLHKLKESIV